MRKIIYYVATSVDGYITGPNEDISGFVPGGNGVDKYLSDLKDFDTVIMGRKTYEFGYKYGLKPGQPAYEHMQHYIFSNTLRFDNQSDQVHVHSPDPAFIKKLKEQKGTSIYLCGGGIFAGWLLDNELIDVLKIKLNPFIQGEGIRLFGGSQKMYRLELKERELYDHGLQMITYDLLYS